MSTEVSAPTSLNRLVGGVFGAVYLAVGLVGFAITNGVGFADHHGKTLIFFELNPLHNLVHIAVGLLLGLAALRGLKESTTVNTLVGGVYLLVGIVGLVISSSGLDILALNHPDNLLHLASAGVLLATGLSRR
ncbi:MAG TPA: DUF4383 domain-containing protein [Streptosporangiaceae bacterium]|jgi:hypothetical protein